MTAAPKKQTAGQKAAAAKATVAAGKKRTPAQVRTAHLGAQKAAATRKRNAAAAAALARKRGKVVPVKARKRAAVAPEGTVGLPGWSWLMACNDFAPTCAAAAVANHLLACTGLAMNEADVLQLHNMAGGGDGADIAAVLETIHSNRSCFGAASKAYLATFTRTDVDCIVSGLVVGVRLQHKGHAVVSHPRGMVSWGRVMPFAGIPEEAWALEWLR